MSRIAAKLQPISKCRLCTFILHYSRHVKDSVYSFIAINFRVHTRINDWMHFHFTKLQIGRRDIFVLSPDVKTWVVIGVDLNVVCKFYFLRTTYRCIVLQTNVLVSIQLKYVILKSLINGYFNSKGKYIEAVPSLMNKSKVFHAVLKKVFFLQSGYNTLCSYT